MVVLIPAFEVDFTSGTVVSSRYDPVGEYKIKSRPTF